MSKIIAIGALGGSGTRAVTQVLIDAGVYMGDNLNHANDNLLFSRLFKDPQWFKHANQPEIAKRIDIFQQYMQQDSLKIRDAIHLLNIYTSNKTFNKKDKFLANTIKKVLNTPINREFWGWKEPNTQIYLKTLANHLPNLKYIHVVRHGLDMAFSNNKQQLANWGYKYDIALTSTESEEELIYKQLSFWIKSTQEAFSVRKALNDNFLLINHTDFCHHPEEQITKILNFLELSVSKEQTAKLYQIPKTPKTLNRYKKYDLGIFDKWQIECVNELGFAV